MSTISTHVLDTSVGRPAAGISVSLERIQDPLGGRPLDIGHGVTTHDQERFVAVTRDRAGRIDEISRRNQEGSDLVSRSATEQAGALQELESATKELRELASHLADLTRRLTRIETA